MKAPGPATDPSGLIDSVLSRLVEWLRLDPDWSTRSQNELAWWPHTYKQVIVGQPPVQYNGRSSFPFFCRIDLLASMPASRPLYEALSLANEDASLSSIVYYPNTQTVATLTRLLMDRESLWLVAFLRLALGVQIRQAERLSRYWQDTLGGQFVRAPHRVLGIREIPDDMVSQFQIELEPSLNDESPFCGLLNKLNVEATGLLILEQQDDRLVVELRFPDNPRNQQRPSANLPVAARLEVSANAQHTQFGRGLSLNLELPVSVSPDDGYAVANTLNLMASEVPVQLIGSWYMSRATHRLTFGCFVPAIIGSGLDTQWRSHIIRTLMTCVLDQGIMARGVFEAGSETDQSQPALAPRPVNRAIPEAADRTPIDVKNLARQHHYIFAHRLLPNTLFNDPTFLIRAGRDQRLLDLWERAAIAAREFSARRDVPDYVRRLDFNRISPDGLECTLIDLAGRSGALIEMPAASHPTEAVWVLVVDGAAKGSSQVAKPASVRYFVLERGAPMNSMPTNYAVETTPTGRRPLGPVPRMEDAADGPADRAVLRKLDKDVFVQTIDQMLRDGTLGTS